LLVYAETISERDAMMLRTGYANALLFLTFNLLQLIWDCYMRQDLVKAVREAMAQTSAIAKNNSIFGVNLLFACLPISDKINVNFPSINVNINRRH
jgi:hypothetical protein